MLTKSSQQHPRVDTLGEDARISRRRARNMRAISCSRMYKQLQAKGTQGRYSLERMSALHEYCECMPLWRVTLVVVLAIVPPLASIVMLDALQLQDPTAAWDANPTFWLRVVLGTWMLSLGVMLQLRALVPAASLTHIHCISISALAAGVFTGCGVLLAKFWVFPVPFLMVVCNPPWSLTLFGATFAAIGKRKFAAQPQIKAQLQRFNTYINIISTFLVIYPVYNMVFRSLDGPQQLAFLLLLPLIKFLLKKATIAIVADVEDTVFVVAIAVDMFNALFQAKCMQSSGSALTTAGIIAIDVVQNVYSLARLTRSVGSLRSRFHQDTNGASILAICADAMKSPDALDLAGLRVQSWRPMDVSASVAAQLHMIRVAQENQRSKRRRSDGSSMETLTAIVPSGVGPTSVVPWPPAPKPVAVQPSLAPMTDSKVPRATPPTNPKSASSAVVKTTLELLWQCERVLLVEFVEFAIPLLYGASMSTLYFLPNAQYYPGIVEMTPEHLWSTVTNILVYSALEFLSLVYLHIFVKRTFSVSIAHQLAFVLTTERAIVQGIFVSWTVVVLSFTLVHYGNDLTLEFAWVRAARSRSS